MLRIFGLNLAHKAVFQIKMSLWIDKHRPTEFSQLDYHKDQADQLRMLVEGGDFPHLLVYGPQGAGKKVNIPSRPSFGTKHHNYLALSLNH